MHWLIHLMGLDDPSGRWELFWSGFGSDLGELSLLMPLWVLMRKHNCHYPWCWRVGRFRVADTHWVLCHKHHPVGKPTKADIDALSAGG